MSFLELAKARYSCRILTAKEIEPEKIDRILQAAIAAPTAKNLQPYKIWKISSPEAMDKLKQTPNYTFGANLALVVGVKYDEAFTRPFDQVNFAQIDGSIVATHIMLAVQDEGLGTTWVGYFDAPKMRELFPDMKDYELIAIFPIGYPSEKAKPFKPHWERRSIEDAVTEL